jgi:ketosteroid isomerase-like protein
MIIAGLPTGGCTTTMDHETQRRSLLEADRTFAAAAAAGDLERLFEWWAEDAVIYPAGMEPVTGRAEIRTFVTRNRAQRGFTMRWETLVAEVSDDATLGYTVGAYEISMEAPDGNPIVRRGRHQLTWRKDAAGAWRCVVEIQAPLVEAGGPDVRPR